MTEEEFLKRWDTERPMYEAWGKFVAERITEEIKPLVAPLSTDIFLRLPVKARVKSDGSFLTKAFYRPEKSYTDPFEQITDKVGVRFVVLLGSEMPIVCTAIERNAEWNWRKDRDVEGERAKDPYLFGYQSDHYIVSNKAELNIAGQVIRPGTPCEVQVRNMLQHAHSELTHDTIYKPSVEQTPEMKRAAAKSMALIEATSDYFERLVQEIKAAVSPNKKLSQDLADFYQLKIGVPDPTKAEGILNDAYASVLGDAGLTALRTFLESKSYVLDRIRDRARSKLLFRQPSILLVYMAVGTKRTEATAAWPFTEAELKPIYVDLGEAMPSS
jgi:ppGpp synthetase/RelA/SpoT-type nucleotidyltranferase